MAASRRPLITRRPIRWAVWVIARSTRTAARCGKRLMMSAAVPATNGVASDVPHHRVQAGPGLPLYVQPGAAISTHLPKLDQLYRPSLPLLAATERTPGYAAGKFRAVRPALPAAATTTTPLPIA